MTVHQKTDLVIEGFSPTKIINEKGKWSDYFALVSDTITAMRAGEVEKVSDLFKQVNRKFNSLEDAEEEDFYHQSRFLKRVADFLKTNQVKPEF